MKFGHYIHLKMVNEANYIKTYSQQRSPIIEEMIAILNEIILLDNLEKGTEEYIFCKNETYKKMKNRIKRYENKKEFEKSNMYEKIYLIAYYMAKKMYKKIKYENDKYLKEYYNLLKTNTYHPIETKIKKFDIM